MSLAHEPLLRWLERLGVALLLAVALVPRLRDFDAPFDREIEGAQGAFFALGAINYERLTIARTGGYPVLNIDLGERDDAATRVWDRPEHWVIYANHPPTAALVAWAALKAFAPEDWNEAWHDARAPRGIEPAIRTPFLLAHVAALLALWWALRQAFDATTAMLGLALASASPVLVVYATLVNYENLALPLVLAAHGFYARFARSQARRDLLGVAVCFVAASTITWAPLFFVLPLAAHALFRVGPRVAVRVLAAGSASCLGTLAVHVAWARATFERLGLPRESPLERARVLWAPLLDGSAPFGAWCALQIERLARWCTLPVLVIALLGLAVTLAPSLRRKLAGPDATRARVDIALPLLAGGALYLLAFYRHTFEPQHSFLMFVAPGVCALAAVFLATIAPRLEQLRAGLAPLVVAASVLALPCVKRFNELRFDLRDPKSELWPPAPNVTADLVAELVEPGSFSVYPASLGLNLAVPFYAWRSLWPVLGAAEATESRVAERAGLADAPRYLLLPVRPLPGNDDLVGRLRRDVARDRAWDACNSLLLAWRLR